MPAQQTQQRDLPRGAPPVPVPKGHRGEEKRFRYEKQDPEFVLV